MVTAKAGSSCCVAMLAAGAGALVVQVRLSSIDPACMHMQSVLLAGAGREEAVALLCWMLLLLTTMQLCVESESQGKCTCCSLLTSWSLGAFSSVSEEACMHIYMQHCTSPACTMSDECVRENAKRDRPCLVCEKFWVLIL